KSSRPFRISLGTPPPLTPADQKNPRALEVVDDLVSQLGIKAITKEAPDSQHRLTIVVQITGIAGNAHVIDEPAPIVGHPSQQTIGRHAAHVILHGKDPPRLVGRVLRMLQNKRRIRRIRYLDHEPLHQNAIEVMGLHPLKMTEDGTRMSRTE